MGRRKRPSGLKIREESMLRFIYEFGIVSEYLLREVFTEKLVDTNEKKTIGKRARKFRYEMKKFIKDKSLLYCIEDFDIETKTNYFLTPKGHRFVENNLRNMDVCYTETFYGKKRKIVCTDLDLDSRYRRIKPSKIDSMKLKEYDEINRVKYTIMNSLHKRVIIPRFLELKADLYTRDKCDLLVEIDRDEYVGIDYENRLKAETLYLGRKIRIGTEWRTYKGIIRSRQDDNFLPYAKLRTMLVLFERKNDLLRYLKYIDYLRSGKAGFYFIDKFFLMIIKDFDSIHNLINNGKALYCRKVRPREGEEFDYLWYYVRDLFDKGFYDSKVCPVTKKKIRRAY